MPAVFDIDTQYYDEYNKLKEKSKKGDAENIFNRLELKHIYLLAIAIALKNGLKPKRSKKKKFFVRAEGFTADKTSFSILKSMIYDYSDCEINILFPHNYKKFFKLCEELANAGMEKTLELLKTPEELESQVLIEGKEII